MAVWNPWRGCHRHSEGCKYGSIHKGDARKGINTAEVVRTDKFFAPIEKKKNGEYKMKPGQVVYLCFQSDFLVEEADAWREECWKMIRQRTDLHFLFLTKRIERFMQCIPPDWENGYDNVTVCCTVENQARADERLSIFSGLPIRHKNIICQPLIERIDIRPYLSGVELVVAGGESDRNARPLDYEWVLWLRPQCMENGIHFEFRQCGTHFIKDGKRYTLAVKDLGSQVHKAGIDI